MVIKNILLSIVISFLMAGSCQKCYEGIGVLIKSRSLGTNDVFSITPLKKIYKVGEKVRIKHIANVVAGLVDSQDKFTGKKVNLYDIGAKMFRVAPPPPI